MNIFQLCVNCFGFGFLSFFSVLFVNKVNGQQETNETGLLSDLWNSLTSVGKAPACPGECVHAITSIFCDNVLEEVTCGANFLRCCVPHEFSFGTPVETSAPINENNSPENSSPEQTSSKPSNTSMTTPKTRISTTTTTTTTITTTTTPKPTEAQAVTSFPLVIRPHNPKPFSPPLVFGSVNVNKLNAILSSSTPAPTVSTTEKTIRTTAKSKISPLESQISQSSISSMAEPCPGVCIKHRFIRYCSNILSNGKCPNDGDQCCLQSEVDLENSSNIVTVVQQSDSHNISKEQSKEQPIERPTEGPIERPKVDDIPQNVEHNKDSPPTTPMPLCEGTCVAPLFSLLCDETDYNLYCPNGGSCCVNREPTTEAPQLKPCPGTCIPTILSGMCNRPSELILKTLDCNSGSICCHNPHETGEQSLKDVTPENGPLKDDWPPERQPDRHHERPLQPPIAPQINAHYNPLLFGSENPIPSFFGGPAVAGPSLLKPPVPNPIPIPMLPNPMHKPQPPKTQINKPPVQEQPPPPVPTPTRPLPLPYAPDSDEDMMEAIENHTVTMKPPGGPPFCPGPCIAPMFRFTCFGGNAIYPKFKCAKSGQICCAPMTDIQAFEANVVANNGIWKTPNTTTFYDDSPIRPLPPRRPNPYMCGIKGTQRQETPRVVGGSDSFPGEWCWQVALINGQNQYLCGGALIGAQWVLTAAHCITNLVRSGETIYVRVGDYDLTSQVGSRGAQTQKVITTYIHHNHNGQTLDNDIALLKLQSPVELNEAVCLVCLPARGSMRKPGKRCTVTGYGYKDETGPIALRVREADVPVVDDQECTVRVNSVTEKLFILPASSFCAGGDEGNDACQGDGGSGLTCEIDGYYELTGLVSWGFGCGRSGVPGVYVKVSAFVGWINQIISVNNQ